MLTRNAQKDMNQVQMVTLDGLVEPLYCEDNGRPSIDPVMLIKLPMINYMFRLNNIEMGSFINSSPVTVFNLSVFFIFTLLHVFAVLFFPRSHVTIILELST